VVAPALTPPLPPPCRPAVLLSLENRPVDLLNTLNDMVADMCYIPGAALAPSAEGLSIIGEWVPLHYDVMRARAAGQYVEEGELEENTLGGIRCATRVCAACVLPCVLAVG
jgi:hypothetical protein